MRFSFNKNLIPYVFFLVLSGIIIFSWFRFGYIYGGGDVGLQTYNPIRISHIVGYIWWEATAPGSPTPQGLTALPFNVIFSFLKFAGFTPLLLQASLFFLVLFCMGLGMYKLILFILGSDYKKFAYAGALFYIFNPYMMIQVWHRFVHSTFFISAALPFLIIYWLKWIRNRSPIDLLIFLLINLLALYGFGTIAYILTLWLLLFLITLPEIIFPWSGFKKTKSIIVLFLIGFLFWITTNIWWILPIFKIAPSFLSEQHSNEQTLATLYALGFQTVIPYSLQMINPFYLFLQLDFGSSYQGIFIRLFPWIFVGIIFTGLIKGIYSPIYARWVLIYIVILILAKGIASPFGYFYDIGMRYFLPLGVLRNPFEKIGVLLPLISSILLAIGLKFCIDILKTRIDRKILQFGFGVILLLIISFCWPMFSGQIFGKIDNPEFVQVPNSYNEVDQWIKGDYSKDLYQNPGKILHLPLTKTESVNYKWEHGYNGLESSALFFTSAPSISHGFNIKQVDNSLEALYQVFHRSPVIPDLILRLLQDFNVKYIVLHKDTKWQGGEFYDPLQTEEVLNDLYYLEKPKKFDNLIVYKISDNFFKPKINLSTQYDLIYPPFSPSLWPWILSQDRTILTQIGGKNISSLDLNPKNTLIFPKNSFSYTEASPSSVLALIDQLIPNKNYDDLWLKPLIDLKEVYRVNNEVQGKEVNDILISASRELLEILRSIFIENKVLSMKSLKDYANKIDKMLFSNSDIVSYYPTNENILAIIQTQLYMLRVIANKAQLNTPEVNKIADEIKQKLVDKNFISSSYQEGTLSDISEKKVFKFEIPKDSEYEFLLTAPGTENVYQDKFKNITVIINGTSQRLTTERKGNLISLGNFRFQKGAHEIDLPVLYSDNLISTDRNGIKAENATFLDQNTVKIESLGNNVGFLQNTINNVVGGDVYKITFDAKVEKGNGFHIRIAQDTDVANRDGQVSYALNQFVNQSSDQDFTNYSFVIPSMRISTRVATILFIVPNDSVGLSSPSLLIKNLQVMKLFNEDVLLHKVEIGSEDKVEGKVSIHQVNPVFYTGKINLEKPSLFIFKESYHPGWKLTLEKQGQKQTIESHYIANLYSNAWYINDIGDYNFKLEFEPQKFVSYGLLVAVISYVGLILYSIVRSFKRYEKK